MRGFFSKRKVQNKETDATPEQGANNRATTSAPKARSSRVTDQFAAALHQALEGGPYIVKQNVLLEQFLAVSYYTPGGRGELSREPRKKVDFLIVRASSGLPVLALMLSTSTYGRDRRRPPEASKDADLDASGMLTLLHVNPTDLVTTDAVLEVIRPHLS